MCTGFDALEIDKSLKAHTSAAAGGYDFPGNVIDLDLGEFWSGSSASHGAGSEPAPSSKPGNQLFAHDLGVVLYDTVSGKWSKLKPGTDRSKNENFRIFGKPLYAMADGKVLGFVDNVKDNSPGKKGSGGGNVVFIQHGQEQAIYAHLQFDSMNDDLKSVGAQVARGDFLGRVGNSGSSGEPHLHLAVVKSTIQDSGPPRPIPFRKGHVIERWSRRPPAPGAPWARVKNQGLPDVRSMIWPSARNPRFLFPTFSPPPLERPAASGAAPRLLGVRPPRSTATTFRATTPTFRSITTGCTTATRFPLRR